MTRRIFLVALLVLALPALALAGHTEPKRQITAADQRKAVSILLKRADFGAGWKRSPATPDTNEHHSCPGYNPNVSDLVLTGEAEADFDAPSGASVSSYANVFKTRREALASWKRSAKPELAPCLATLLKREIEKSGAKVAIARNGTLALPRYAPRGVAYRVAMTVTGGNGAKFAFTLHVIALGNGRGDAVIMTLGVGSGVPMAELRKYAKLTATRLAAAKL